MNGSTGTPIDIQSTYPVDLSNCEREPIHIPGSIQPHGVLIVAALPNLEVLYVSANVESIAETTASALLGRPLQAWLGHELCDRIAQRDGDGRILPERSRTLTLPLRGGVRHHVDIRHFNDLLYLEIEVERIVEEDSLPDNAAMLIEALHHAGSLEQLLHTAAYQLRKLTGYDRVMVYRFNREGHGHVVAEDCDAAMDPYLDLHYPASDIPTQARKLYLMQRIRVMADVNYVPVPLLAEAGLDTYGEPPPLDMTVCGLRSMSPIHIEYLKNMGVQATLTLSLIVKEQLWGLLVCHHRNRKLPSHAMRSNCNLLSQIISFMIEQAIEQDESEETTHRKQLVETIADSLKEHGAIAEGLAAAERSLLSLVGASGALVCFEGKSLCVGDAPSVQDSLRILSRLRAINAEKIFAHDSLATLLPEFEPLRAEASGVLMMAILGSHDEGILWFRPETIRTVKWGGNPEKAAEVNALTGRISPRKSFDVWTRLVELRSLPWQAVDLDVAIELKRVISAHVMTQAETLLSRSSQMDSMTLLPNRRHFQARLKEWEQRPDFYPAGVILIDLDRFKRVNEAFGHGSGDDLLVQVARRLSRFISNDLVLARLSGDEFAIFCTGMSADEVEEIARQIVGEFSAPFHIRGRAFRATASLGISHSSHGGEEELLRAADVAMHLAKRNGRNRAVSFDQLLQKTATATLELEQDLYRALEEGEFELAYQPIFSQCAHMLYGFEALIRWNHPEKGLVPPLDFIPLSEEIGLILPIGKWVLREAIKTQKSWLNHFGERFIIHVNVAASQLIAPDFVSYMAELLREYEVDPGSVSIEVTESVLMRDLAVDTLRELRNLGFGVSVDDFGTGFSSLAYLQKLPVDIVKIDRSFVRDIATDTNAKDFFGALVQLIRTLGLQVIVEGVETAPQSGIVLENGCSLAQGYYFSRPLNRTGVEEFLTRR